jgi:hypothetical protein
VNDEFEMLKEAVMSYNFRYYVGIFLERLRRTRETSE